MSKAYYLGCLAVFAMLASACSARPSLSAASAAPELSNQVWLNSPPLKLANLRGKVVVIDFWTFG